MLFKSKSVDVLRIGSLDFCFKLSSVFDLWSVLLSKESWNLFGLLLGLFLDDLVRREPEYDKSIESSLRSELDLIPLLFPPLRLFGSILERDDRELVESDRASLLYVSDTFMVIDDCEFDDFIISRFGLFSHSFSRPL